MQTLHTAVVTHLGYSPNLAHSTRVDRWLKDLGIGVEHVTAERDHQFEGWTKVYQGEIHRRSVYSRPHR